MPASNGKVAAAKELAAAQGTATSRRKVLNLAERFERGLITLEADVDTRTTDTNGIELLKQLLEVGR